MSTIDLSSFIYQIKRDLLAPNPKQKAKDPWPLFAIDSIDLEIAVSVQKSQKGELSFTVLDRIGGSVGSSHSQEQAHIVRVSLSPLLSKEALLVNLLQDPAAQRAIKQGSIEATLRDDNDMPQE